MDNSDIAKQLPAGENLKYKVSGQTAEQEQPVYQFTTPITTALGEAGSVIYGDREKTYGDPGKNIRTIADYWSIHLSRTTGQKVRLTTNDVCVMMVLLKQARQANTPGHRDSIVDTIGYAALQDRINSSEVVPVVPETK